MQAEYDSNNIFARILRGELPCFKVYEDADTIAFMDIMPQSDGHTLVVPKEQAVDVFGLSEAGAAAAIRATQIVARGVREARKNAVKAVRDELDRVRDEVRRRAAATSRDVVGPECR